MAETLPLQGATADKLFITRDGDRIIERPAATEPAKDVAPVAGAADKTDTVVNNDTLNTALKQDAAAEKPNETEKDPATPAATTEGQETTEVTDQTPQEYTDADFHQDVNSYLEIETGGAIKSPADIKTILDENIKLKADLKHKEPDFPNDVAKKIYELATKARPGSEMATARQAFHVMSLDLSTMTPKDKQFEAFHLERPNLSREEAAKRFDARYDKMFNDLDTDLVQLDEHEKLTHEAELKIKDAQKLPEQPVKQSGTSDDQRPTPEQEADLVRQIDSALTEFAGVALKFDDSRYGTLQIPMDKGKANQFKEVLTNPHLLVNRIVDSCKGADGKFNYQQYVRDMYLLFNRDGISQAERDHLMKLGKISEIQERKNTPIKPLTEEKTTAPKKNFQTTFAEAVAGAGLAN